MLMAVTSRQQKGTHGHGLLQLQRWPHLAGAMLLSGMICGCCTKARPGCVLLLSGPHCGWWLPAGSTGETGTRSGASLSDLTYSDVSQPGSAGSEQAST